MNGKKFIAILNLVFFLFSSSAQAMTVSDPGSYGYFVQQLSEAKLQLAAAKEQIANQMQEIKVLNDTYKMATEQLKELNDIKDQVKGYYDQGKAFVGKIRSIKAGIEAIPSTVMGRGKEMMSLLDDIGNFTEAADMLDGIFGDPRSPNYDPWQTLGPKYQLRQKGLKDCIEHSEKLLAGMKDKFAGLEELMSKIDETENIKEAQDLTNVFLALIASILNEQLALAAQIGESQALLNFSGVKDGELKAQQDRRAEKVSKYNEAIEAYKSKAGDTDSSVKSFIDIVNQ